MSDYTKAIKEANELYDFVFISSHPVILDKLDEMGLSYTVVTPSVDMKNLMMDRYSDRGNPKEFIDLMDKNYELFVSSMIKRASRDNVSIKMLTKERLYISDIFNKKEGL